MIGIVVDVCNFVALTVSGQRVVANRFHAFRTTRIEQRAVAENLNLNARKTNSSTKSVRNRV